MNTQSIFKPHIAVIALALFTLMPSGCRLVYIQGLSGNYSKDELAHNAHFRWNTDTSTHCEFFFEAQSWTSRNIFNVKRDAEQSFAHILALLHEAEYPHRLTYFIVNNRSQMDLLINQETNGRAFPGAQLICAIANDSVRALGAHEMFHVVATNVWGSTEDWINEGMAVYSDNQWWMQDLHPLAHYLIQKGKLLTLNDLTQRFSHFDPLITYPEAGSFLKYFFEAYGHEKVELLWKQGLAACCRSVRLSKTELEQHWLAAISRFETTNVHYRIPE